MDIKSEVEIKDELVDNSEDLDEMKEINLCSKKGIVEKIEIKEDRFHIKEVYMENSHPIEQVFVLDQSQDLFSGEEQKEKDGGRKAKSSLRSELRTLRKYNQMIKKKDTITMAKRVASAVWQYFTICENQELSKCNICGLDLRRGPPGAASKVFSTKSLWNHLKSKHRNEYLSAEEERSNESDRKRKKLKKQQEKAEVFIISRPEASTSKQLTLQEAMNVSKKWDLNNHDQMEGEKLLIYWLCDGLKAYETVENEHFLKFISHLCKKFKVPSEKRIRTKLVPDLNKKVQFCIKRSLSSTTAGAFAITTDIWSSPSRDSFMSVTAHWISSEYERKLAVLRCIRYNTTHDARNISTTLKGILKDWGLNNIHVIVRDNANNIVLAVEKAGYRGIGCFCHILHLIVKHSIFEETAIKTMILRLRKLVKKLQKPKSKSIFSKYQTQVGVCQNVLILDCETRWGSTLAMLERALEQKQAIKIAEDDTELCFTSDSKMTPNDWDLLSKAIALLTPIHRSSMIAERDTASLADVIPLTKKIKFELEAVPEAGVATLKNALLYQIHRYLEGGDSRKHFQNIEENPLTAVATLLDPRYKSAAFQNKDLAQKAIERALSLVLNEISQNQLHKNKNMDLCSAQSDSESEKETITVSPSPHLSSWDAILAESEDSNSSSGISPSLNEAALTELNKYMKMKKINIDDDPLAFWRLNRNDLPNLATIAATYLSPPASSSASEREFKVGKSIQKDRIKLLPKNVEMLLFLKYNLRGIGHMTTFPSIPEDFTPPNSEVYDESNYESSDSDVSVTDTE